VFELDEQYITALPDACQVVDTGYMSTHKLFVANAVYPHFTSTPSKYRNFDGRADDIAALVKKSGADVATFGEMGYYQAKALAEALGSDWQYDRAHGSADPGKQGEGLNCVFSKRSVWKQPEDGLRDHNMPSGNEWQRTLLLAGLTEVKDSTAHIFVGAYHETLDNAVGLAYVKAMVKAVGRKRVILGGDFKRTGDNDDLAYMKAKGFTVHERVEYTPMACFTKGAVTVTDVDHLENSKCFDHEYLVVTFSIKNKKPDPA
jgi:hypothetical protein